MGFCLKPALWVAVYILFWGHTPTAHARSFQETCQVLTREVFLKLGVLGHVKQSLLQRVIQPHQTELRIPSGTLALQCYLGSGMDTDVFLTEINGKLCVAKIAHDSPEARANTLESIQIQKLTQEHSTLPIPELVDHAPDGSWVIQEFIEGENLRDVVAEHGISPPVRAQLRNVFEETKRFYQGQGIALDLMVENLILSPDGSLIPIDFGKTPHTAPLRWSFARFEKHLIAEARQLARARRCQVALKSPPSGAITP